MFKRREDLWLRLSQLVQSVKVRVVFGQVPTESRCGIAGSRPSCIPTDVEIVCECAELNQYLMDICPTRRGRS